MGATNGAGGDSESVAAEDAKTRSGVFDPALLFGRRVVPTWTKLLEFMPHGLGTPLKARSALAAHFVASLEMCRDGELEISQEETFGPILLRSPQTVREGDLPRNYDYDADTFKK